MTEEEWLVCTNSERMLKYLAQAGSDRKLQLFGVACCRQIADHFTLSASAEAVELAEQMADGSVNEDERARKWLELYDTLSGLYDSGDHKWADIAAERVIAKTSSEATMTDEMCLVVSAVAEAVNGQETSCSALIRDVFGNPFGPVAFLPEWRTSTAVAIAQGMYESRDFSAMPILADALQDAGCESDDILNHLRDPNAAHVRGCWALDLILGKA